MKEFDLQRALAGDAVVTRDSHDVIQLLYFDKIEKEPYCKLYGYIKDFQVCQWDDEGKFLQNGEHHLDLFMKLVKRKVYINIHSDKDSIGRHRTSLAVSENDKMYLSEDDGWQIVEVEIDV
jgi:hypothetical protein